MTAPDDPRLAHLFVYGTLRPGDVRWHLLAPFVVDDGRPDTAGGTVYDTGRRYPAAVFGTDGTIHGRTYELRWSTIDDCLALLDVEEGIVEGEYRRVTVMTGAAVAAWAYEYGGGLDLVPIESGDWFDR